jgi:uncharacterized metal-binding protein
VLLYLQQRYLHGAQTTWQEQYFLLRGNVLSYWRGADRRYLIAGFAGLSFGAFTHTAADVVWSALKKFKRAF